MENSEQVVEESEWIDKLADEIVILSQDVEGLYPELQKADVIRIIGRLVEESEIKFENVNYKVLGKYLAIHLSPEVIRENNLKSVIPKKVKTGNRKAGIAFLDTDKDKDGEDKWDWKGKRMNPTIIQKKKMVARAMEVAVETIMENHLYQFDGRVYRQKDGGPIGLEITGR